MARYLFYLKLLLLSGLLLGARVHAEQTVVFGVMDIEFPPFQYIVDGKPIGPDADIIREAFARLPDYKLAYKIRPVKRVAKEIENGSLDITAVFKTPPREKFALFT
ncbi:MAG: transporter substrate-binding domain-containing protein, partial [Bermanella sp.]